MSTAAAARLEFAPPPQPGVLRDIALALLAHLGLVALLSLGVQWRRDDQSLSVQAELWSQMPQEAAPREQPTPLPPPAPETKPETQPPPAPDEAAIALQRLRQRQHELEQRRQARLQAEQERQQRVRAEQAAARERQRLEAQRKAAQEKAEAQKLEAQRQENLLRLAGMASASGGTQARGTAQQSSGPSAGYAAKLRARIRPNIVYADDTAGNPVAEVEVRTAASGTILSRRLLHSSGVPAWDEAVLKAIDKTGELPHDVDGRVPAVLVITFRPRD
jgi:colicin import membrane protein